MLPPRTLHAFLAHCEAARALRRARSQFAGAQQATLSRLIETLAHTDFGRTQGLVPGLTYEEFRRTIAPTGPAQLLPWIERTAAGQPDQLWPGHCRDVHTWTPGNDSAERVLLTPALRSHLACGLVQSLQLAGRRAWGRSTHGSTQFITCEGATDGPLAALQTAAPDWLNPMQTTLGPGTGAGMKGDSTDAIGTLATLLGTDAPPPSPPVGAQLRRLLVVGGSVTLFSRELKRRYGPSLDLRAVYSPAGTMLACQDSPDHEGMLVLGTCGVFVEFVPLAETHEDRLSACGAKAVPLHQVSTGVDYLPLITSPGGLCRYLTSDVVRFVSTHPPRLVVRGSRHSALSLSGVVVTQADLWAALNLVCTRHDWDVVHVHVAPLTTESLIGQRRARHEWWIELRPETEETPTGPLLAIELDRELENTHAGYRAARKTGTLDSPVARLVMPGVFAAWRDESPQPKTSSRVVNSRNDRAIADPLTRIARFAKDQ